MLAPETSTSLPILAASPPHCSPPDTVVSANTIDTFKARLDRFWSDQEVKYNWKSDIITGSRSQVSVIIE